MGCNQNPPLFEIGLEMTYQTSLSAASASLAPGAPPGFNSMAEFLAAWRAGSTSTSAGVNSGLNSKAINTGRAISYIEELGIVYDNCCHDNPDVNVIITASQRDEVEPGSADAEPEPAPGIEVEEMACGLPDSVEVTPARHVSETRPAASPSKVDVCAPADGEIQCASPAEVNVRGPADGAIHEAPRAATANAARLLPAPGDITHAKIELWDNGKPQRGKTRFVGKVYIKTCSPLLIGSRRADHIAFSNLMPPDAFTGSLFRAQSAGRISDEQFDLGREAAAILLDEPREYGWPPHCCGWVGITQHGKGTQRDYDALLVCIWRAAQNSERSRISYEPRMTLFMSGEAIQIAQPYETGNSSKSAPTWYAYYDPHDFNALRKTKKGGE